MIFDRRRAGVLLHITSLPGKGATGTLGNDAFAFVDFLAKSGLSVWQVLPLGPTLGDGSPYQSTSSFALNPELLDLSQVLKWPGINQEAIDKALEAEHPLSACWHAFEQSSSNACIADFEAFELRNQYWLDDFSCFCLIRENHDNASWVDWPTPLKDREPSALKELKADHQNRIEELVFEQYVLFRTWIQLRAYANERNIQLYGDLPIFVSHDSADVWADRKSFNLTDEGTCKTVAGVPPDYFSATGQRWGNPHYDWGQMKQDDFAWWRNRMAHQLSLFDLVRVDHFRGFEAFWVIDASEPTAINGHWEKGPGEDLFDSLKRHLGDLPIVAEDLGVITPEVTALRKRYDMPGMKILQFAFDSDAQNPYLPHQHSRNSVTYTGTHDNDTILGWYHSADERSLAYLKEYLGTHELEMPWTLIRMSFASVSELIIVPLQDFLEQDASGRMNTPGTTEGNWHWRFEQKALSDALAQHIHRLCQLYGRLPKE